MVKLSRIQKPIFKFAFTLVELLVVIAIIGILATLAIVSIQNTRSKARDTKRIADIKQIQTALELYFNDNGSYPVSTSVTSSIRSLNRSYMEGYPQAPTPPDGDCTESNNQYVYTETGEDNGSYTLFFCLGGTNSGVSSGLAVASPVGVEYGSFENLRVGLVGHWALDNIDGVVDKSTSGNDGTAQGGITIGGAIDRNGQAGGATTFDGSNDYIDCGNILTFEMTDFSASFWVKTSGNSDYILSFGRAITSPYYGWHIITSVSGKINYFQGKSGGYDNINSLGTINNNIWHFVAVVKSGADLTYYINGIGETPQTVASAILYNSVYRNFRIGKITGSEVDTYNLNGSLADVRIYNRALSEEEIQQLYLLEN
ncbi:MAG: LamG-like jellyroll fold domain-containing protein [Patescibacteria group bacterium]|jgi:prepilin-type N-terminal cleavage/methylation domain-containing protein